MAFHIVYKTLFEVHLLSDYLLTNSESFYLLSTGEDEAEKALKLLKQGYNILNYLSIEPSEQCKSILRGHHMIFRETPLGFSIGIQVKANTLDETYEPFVPVSPGLRMSFHLRLRDQNFINFSNVRLKPNLPAIFYFSNVDPGNELSYPYLSLPSVDYASGRRYEMGEWVRNGGQVFQAQTNIDSATAPGGAGWSLFGSTVRYANYRDQKLLPNRFPYRFTNDPGNPVMDAEFELIGSTVTGEGVISVGGSGEGPFSSVPLKFPDEKPGPYLLVVSSGGGYTEQKEIILDEEKYDHRDFGLIEIGHDDALGDFRLLEVTGELRMESGALQHPVFKITFRNRATYWKYFLHEKDDPQVIIDPDFDVFETDGYIVSKEPRLLTVAGKQFPLLIDSTDMMLPSPADLMIKPRPDKTYSESYYMYNQRIII